MQPTGPSICASCAHLHPEIDDFLHVPNKCDAFPKRIPPKYRMNGQPHLESDGTDNGIVYKPDPAEEENRLTYMKFHPGIRL